MSTIIAINPGTGHIPEHNEKNAIVNMKVFYEEIRAQHCVITRNPNEDFDGYYNFQIELTHDDPHYQSHQESNLAPLSIDMPGLPLDKVHYTGAEGQNIWHFQRLYVDGSSWVWEFAINCSNHWYNNELE